MSSASSGSHGPGVATLEGVLDKQRAELKRLRRELRMEQQRKRRGVQHTSGHAAQTNTTSTSSLVRLTVYVFSNYRAEVAAAYALSQGRRRIQLESEEVEAAMEEVEWAYIRAPLTLLTSLLDWAPEQSNVLYTSTR